jgi:protein-tyrosine phosphatase
MRSPFAREYCLRTADAVAPPLAVVSAGLHDLAGRAADPRAVAAGRQWGVDLSGHRSRLVDDDLVRWADLILVMDRSNLRGIRARYPNAAAKTYLLGLLEPVPDAEIPDPYTADPSAMASACGHIAVAIDTLLRERHGHPASR